MMRKLRRIEPVDLEHAKSFRTGFARFGYVSVSVQSAACPATDG